MESYQTEFLFFNIDKYFLLRLGGGDGWNNFRIHFLPLSLSYSPWDRETLIRVSPPYQYFSFIEALQLFFELSGPEESIRWSNW